jgi:hypothetical protein
VLGRNAAAPIPSTPPALVGWPQRPSRSRRASSAFTVTLPVLTVGSRAIRSPAGRLALAGLAGKEPLAGAGGQVVGAGCSARSALVRSSSRPGRVWSVGERLAVS